MKEVELSDFRSFKVFPVLIYLAALFFLGYTTDTSPLLVFLAMSPALLTLITLFIFDPNLKSNQVIAFLAPAIYSMFFMLAWASKAITILDEMHGPVIALLNVILGYIMIPFFITWVREPKEMREEEDLSYDTDNLEELNNLRESLKIYKQGSAADAKELARLRSAITSYEHRAKQDAEIVYNMRESIAAYEQQSQQYYAELKRMHDSLTLHELALAEGKDADPKEIDRLRKTISAYEKEMGSIQTEVARLRQTVNEYAEELKVTKQNMPKTLRSIEDKCKAINFVIGRVYSDKKGGSPDLREKILIPRDHYNTFSDLVRNPKKVDADHLLGVLAAVMQRLSLLERQERGFIDVGEGWVDVKRFRHDTVLDVLANNDKDPVKEYHAEAKEICEKLLVYLNSTVIKG